MNFREIFSGWRNLAIPPAKLKEQIEQVASFRLEICNVCPHNSKNKVTGKKYIMDTCTLCGCPLKAKTRCLNCKCPDNPPHWEAVTSEEDRWAIEDQIKKNEE